MHVLHVSMNFRPGCEYEHTCAMHMHNSFRITCLARHVAAINNLCFAKVRVSTINAHEDLNRNTRVTSCSFVIGVFLHVKKGLAKDARSSMDARNVGGSGTCRVRSSQRA